MAPTSQCGPVMNNQDDTETVGLEELATVTGGMKWEDFRPSTNVEDRRSPAGIRSDQEYWDRSHAPAPLPPSRPADLGAGAPVPLPPQRPAGP
jgi:hypothetical protein